MSEKLSRPKGENNEYDFELPVLEENQAARPRVHSAPGESVCTSCEG